MSYTRRCKGESDVYVFANVNGDFECCSCLLADGVGSCTTTSTAGEMLGHMQTHREHGHLVPQRAVDGLLRDALGDSE